MTPVCPACQGDLLAADAEATCRACGRSYPVDGANYDLRFEGALAPERARWEHAQALGSSSYLLNPTANCSRWLESGRYARAFGEFCRLSGRVLDVGCGPYGPYELYASAPGTELIGIDPLPAAHSALPMYRAMAEHLPFAAGTFDHVIMVSSLDHVLDPIVALVEARRVLRPGGRLHVWTHVHPPASRRIREFVSAALRRLFQLRRWPSILSSARTAFTQLRRDAAEPDEHHLRLLGPQAAQALLQTAGFSVDRQMSCDGHVFFLSGTTRCRQGNRPTGAPTGAEAGA